MKNQEGKRDCHFAGSCEQWKTAWAKDHLVAWKMVSEIRKMWFWVFRTSEDGLSRPKKSRPMASGAPVAGAYRAGARVEDGKPSAISPFVLLLGVRALQLASDGVLSGGKRIS